MLRRVFAKLPFPYGVVIEAQSRDDSYLVSTGWARSRRERAPVDREGRPLPWYTYPAIRFLEARMRPHFRVFEFGAGNSTRWWAERVAGVHAVEHDAGWVDRLRPQLGGNAAVEYRPVDSADYPVPDGGPFDIVVIDGRRRNECARHAVAALAGNGVIVWDNSERERYDEGKRHLVALGFRQLDFWGVVPGNVKEIATSIFYRADNCLGI